ncbi:hypothetical protein G6O67_007087 [Ophiocordyceps sinensis]|uniref:Uncharacterized protein n=1 Tax=Ophiocordyceps sinensis TaxID=72228 RepID=A0A8H4PLG9_9HYPO|nr:hypothetical protein G6O67_007087 [Ophiocordyceps sinensis]
MRCGPCHLSSPQHRGITSAKQRPKRLRDECNKMAVTVEEDDLQKFNQGRRRLVNRGCFLLRSGGPDGKSSDDLWLHSSGNELLH